MACSELKHLRGKEVSGSTASAVWQGRAQDAEHRLFQLYSQLLALPDPQLVLENVSGLSAKVLGKPHAGQFARMLRRACAGLGGMGPSMVTHTMRAWRMHACMHA